MRRHLAAAAGYAAGYSAVVLLERVLRRLEEQQAAGWAALDQGHTATLYPVGIVRPAAWCSCSSCVAHRADEAWAA